MFRGLHAVCLSRHSGSYVVCIRHATIGTGPSRSLNEQSCCSTGCPHTDKPWTRHRACRYVCVSRNDPETTTKQRLRWSATLWSPPPESNRRHHPYHVSPAHRHAALHLPRSQRTVGGTVMGCNVVLSSGPSKPSVPGGLPACACPTIVQRPFRLTRRYEAR
jgi:hypothetical protein